MNCRSCVYICGNDMMFFGDAGNNKEGAMGLCCEPILGAPSWISFEETPEETLHKFIDQCRMIDRECRNIKDDSKRHFTKGCVNCSNFKYGPYHNDGLVHFVNLTMCPAPCQCRCIYCDVYNGNQDATSETAIKLYDHTFDVLELALERGLIANDATYQVSSGEITIHPHRDRFMKILKGKPAYFFTNAMKFDEDIAQNLHDNPGSAINLSIDSGTRETWHKVKGLDNFDKVIENLSKYFVRTTRPGQITLKYIILPGINDTYEDFISVAEIMKVLNVSHLSISRDVYTKYSMSEQDTVNLTGAAAYLLAVLSKNGLRADLMTYSPEERQMVVNQANEVLAKGLV